MPKNLEISFLLDFYGDILTPKQKETIEYYYNDDLSLGEIASNQGITRQGVRDTIKRAEMLMYDMEERLGLAQKFRDMQEGLERILKDTQRIEDQNNRSVFSKEIYDCVVEIKEIAQRLCE